MNQLHMVKKNTNTTESKHSEIPIKATMLLLMILIFYSLSVYWKNQTKCSVNGKDMFWADRGKFQSGKQFPELISWKECRLQYSVSHANPVNEQSVDPTCCFDEPGCSECDILQFTTFQQMLQVTPGPTRFPGQASVWKSLAST